MQLRLQSFLGEAAALVYSRQMPGCPAFSSPSVRDPISAFQYTGRDLLWASKK